MESIKLPYNHWSQKLIEYCFGKEIRYNNFCLHAKVFLLACISLPFIIVFKLYKKITLQIKRKIRFYTVKILLKKYRKLIVDGELLYDKMQTLDKHSHYVIFNTYLSSSLTSMYEFVHLKRWTKIYRNLIYAAYSPSKISKRFKKILDKIKHRMLAGDFSIDYIDLLVDSIVSHRLNNRKILKILKLFYNTSLKDQIIEKLKENNIIVKKKVFIGQYIRKNINWLNKISIVTFSTLILLTSYKVGIIVYLAFNLSPYHLNYISSHVLFLIVFVIVGLLITEFFEEKKRYKDITSFIVNIFKALKAKTCAEIIWEK